MAQSNEAKRLWRARNRERDRAYGAKYRATHREQERARYARHRLKERQAELVSWDNL
jgi:hypothetical protein